MSKRSQSGDVKMTRTVSLGPQGKRAKQFVRRPIKGSRKLKALIKSTINQLAEKKMFISSAANAALFTAAGISPNGFTLVPQISQGTGQNQRVGNQVRVTKGTIRGHVAVLPYSAITNTLIAPVSVKIWICRYKKSMTAALGTTDANTAFFDTGSGVAGFQGTLLDMEMYPNTDSWEVLQTKSFKLGLSSGTNSTPSTNAMYFDNSPAIYPFQFEFGSSIGLLTFNDNTADATNKSLFYVIQPVYSNGQSSANLAPCELAYAYKVEYIDV